MHIFSNKNECYIVKYLSVLNSTARGFPISNRFLRLANEIRVLMISPRSDSWLLLRSSDTRPDLTTDIKTAVVITLFYMSLVPLIMSKYVHL